MGIDSVKDSVTAGLSSAVSSASAPFTTLAATPEDAGEGAPSGGALGAWAASLALKGIEKVKEKVASLSASGDDAARKLSFEIAIDLKENNLPAVKRKMMLFKKWTEGTSDPELSKMREEVRGILREINLAAVEELKKANEALLEQRLAHLDLLTPHFVSKMKAEKNGRALDLLANLIKKGAVDTVEEGLKIVKPLMADDPDLMRLVELETKKGLRDIDTPEKMRKRDLETAKELRHRDGSYLIAEGKLKAVLDEEIRGATASITPDEAKTVRDEVHHKIYIYNRVREKAIEAINKLKEEDPGKFKEEYPESFRRGYLYEDELKRKMNEIYAVLVDASKEKFALKKIGERYEAGKILDPIAREAWLTLDRMKDPTDDWLEMSDESWDRVVDDAVVMAVTGVVTGGVGSLTRFGMGALSRGLVARGGAWALAADGATAVGVTAAESLAMEGVNYGFTGEFDPKNLAFNALTSGIFHGGPALARGLGFVDEMAEGLAAKAKNLAGTLSVQTLLDTGVGYLHDATIGHGDERALWERLFQGALRMGGFHAVGVLTGHVTTRMEIPTKVRTDALPVAARRAITRPPGIVPSPVHTRVKGGLTTPEGTFLDFGPVVFPKVTVGDVTLRFHKVRYPAGTYRYEVSYVGGPLSGKDAVVRFKRPGMDGSISVPRFKPGKANSGIPVREGDVLEANGKTFRFGESRKDPSVKDLPFPDAETLEARLGSGEEAARAALEATLVWGYPLEATLVGGYPPKKTSLERTFETPITEAEFDSMFRESERSSPAADKAPPPGSAMAPDIKAWDLDGGRNLMSPEAIAVGREAAFDKASDERVWAAVKAAETKGDIAPATWQGHQGPEDDCVSHALANMSNGRFNLKDVKDLAASVGIDPSKGMHEPELKNVLAELEILSAAKGVPVDFKTYPSSEFFKIAEKKYRSEGTRPAGLAILRVGEVDSHAVVVRGQIFIDGHPFIVVTDSHANAPLLYPAEHFAEVLLSDGIITVDDVKR